MIHRLYDETCAERWARKKKREAEARAHRIQDHGHNHPVSKDDDSPIVTFPAAPGWTDPAPTALPDLPSTIDPGGGTGGGGGASGDY